MVSRAEVESYFSRMPPWVRRFPKVIYVLPGGEIITASNPYEQSELHHMNAVMRDGEWKIRGMHAAGADSILVAGKAPVLTSVHELVHMNPYGPFGTDFPNEPATRKRADGLVAYADSPWLPHLLSQPVRYAEQPVTGEELRTFERENHLRIISGPETVSKWVLVSSEGRRFDSVWEYGR